MDIHITEEQVAWCALATLFGYTPAVGAALAGRAGGARELFRLSPAGLRDLAGADAPVLRQIRQETLESAAGSLEKIAREGCRFLPLSDPDYPGLLKECPDPPLGLYYKGTGTPHELFSSRTAIAVVGTRDMSRYGAQWCSQLVHSLGECPNKPLIVSGLALGVDITAHEAALKCGLPTIAVMATGIDAVYPARHAWAADRIASSPGSALVTDYPPGTAPLAANFLRRNRIIAGLCGTTVLVESKIRGGGMMTARLAASYNRTVYALPGRLEDIRSQGCNKLIGDKTAEPLTDLDAFLADLGLKKKPVRKKVAEEALSVRVHARYSGCIDGKTAGQLELLARLIQARQDITLEELASESGLDWGAVTALSAILECDGFIRTDLLQRCSIRKKY